MAHPLDNPVWASLTGRHQAFARTAGRAARYPPQIAPFAAVDAFDAVAAEQLATLLEPGETVLFVGPSPAFGAGWNAQPLEHIAQMVWDAPRPETDRHGAITLDERHHADVLDLTSRVYPHYFRPRTVDMGRYVGIYDGTRLAAMAGERMGFDGHVELSAICTDPAYLGRGLARRLIALLVAENLDASRLPFLHVSHRNARALALYEGVGFRLRSDIALLSATRLPSG
jgi:ribosomal protein S18 acetylase RimI-like enzyme